jgi:replicative DNA helicase
MVIADDSIARFYLKNLHDTRMEETFLNADCPFCREKGMEAGRLVVFLNKDSFFYGYFRCLNRCVAGGFALWFARVAGISPTEVPGYRVEQNDITVQPEYPVENINDEVQQYRDRITTAIVNDYAAAGIGKTALSEMQVGFNGRYIVYPYLQGDENCYSARCVYPDREDDFFWHGNEAFSVEPYNLFNLQDIQRCDQGALFVCEGEDNLLTIKQLGFPGVAVPHYSGLEKLSSELFAHLKTVFIVTANSSESVQAAKNLASRIGFKARILYWAVNSPRRYSLWQLAKDSGKGFAREVRIMLKRSKSFSPFSTPRREYELFFQNLAKEQREEYLRLSSGFSLLDKSLGGIHGINVVGGAPKVGKSTFVIQIASEMALRKVPVLYYDFENGRQKIYQRTLSRLSQLSTAELKGSKDEVEIKNRYDAASGNLEKMFDYLRVINDRKVTPELMRKHIDFIRHETGNEYTVVVIDSLHKLPFKDFSERRTGIDAWLRQLESIRDEMQVSFLVISELSRGGKGTYADEPHLGIFKGSGDIEYSADNAMVLSPSPTVSEIEIDLPKTQRLWLVASREHSPGPVADYRVEYPYWGFSEHPVQ